jgi:hypothetical protein
MTVDPWQHMLYQIEPAYDKYKRIMEEGPRFKVELSLLGNHKCQILIREIEGFTAFGELDEKCEWAADQLKSWPNCHRVAWDRWRFEHRKDAAKFRTLFTLKWAR